MKEDAKKQDQAKPEPPREEKTAPAERDPLKEALAEAERMKAHHEMAWRSYQAAALLLERMAEAGKAAGKGFPQELVAEAKDFLARQ